MTELFKTAWLVNYAAHGFVSIKSTNLPNLNNLPTHGGGAAAVAPHDKGKFLSVVTSCQKTPKGGVAAVVWESRAAGRRSDGGERITRAEG